MDYDFPVKLSPVFTKSGIEVPNRMAVVRTDEKKTLGFVSPKYQLLTHASVVHGFRKALKGTKFTESVKVQKDGSRLFATYALPRETAEVKKGDAVAMRFHARNSYDGANSLQISLGAVRLICTNGMVMEKKFLTFTQRHVGEESEVNASALAEAIEQLSKQFKDSVPVMRKMTHTAVKRKEIFDPAFIDLPEYLLKAAAEEYEKDKEQGTQWSAYNAMTAAITHHMRKENPRAQLKLGRVAWEVAQTL